MKNTFLNFVAFALFAICSASAQSVMDPPSLFNGSFDGDTVQVYTGQGDVSHIVRLAGRDSSIGFSEHFIIGNQWGAAPAGISRRLGINFENETLDYQKIRDIKFDAISGIDTTYIIWRPGYWLSGEGENERQPCPRYCYSKQWVPAAPQTDFVPDWEPRAGDNTGATYGFAVRDSITGSIPDGGANSGLYVLNKHLHDSLGGGARLVLDSACSQHELFTLNDSNPADSTLWNGRHWYLAINLRRADGLDNIADTAVVLTVQLPYVTFPNELTKIITSDSIIFDSVSAIDTAGIYDTVRTSRGLMDRALPDSASVPGFDKHTLIIRRNMLPKWKPDGSHDITISAFFRTENGSRIDYFNPPLRSGEEDELVIDRLGARVYYHGGCSVAISWLRIETPQSRKLFRGILDTSLAARISYIMDTIDKRRENTKWSKVKLAGFYFNDEPKPAEYQAMRYVGKLLGGHLVTEGPANNRFIHLTQPAFVWNGSYNPSIKINPPYSVRSWNGVDSEKVVKLTVGLKGGRYRKIKDTIVDIDLGARYEELPVPDTNITSYFNNANSNWSTGLGLCEGAANETPSYRSILYGDKIWVHNQLNRTRVAGWSDSTRTDCLGKYLAHRWERPMTGEELRFSVMYFVGLGAKGIFYDAFPFSVHTDKTLTGRINYKLSYGLVRDYNLKPSDTICSMSEADSLLRSDDIGGDFFVEGDTMHIERFLDFDTVSAYSMIPRSRIYLGVKSNRLEMKKLHDWIRSCEQELMSLRLQSYWGKGYRLVKHNRYNDSVFESRFLRLNPDDLTARPLWHKTADPWDSLHLDIAVHKSATRSLDSVFYVFIGNRRSSPLLVLPDSLLQRYDSLGGFKSTDTLSPRLTFLTTHEFDSLTLNEYGTLSGAERDFWASMRYMQTGAREVTLPFSYHSLDGRYSLLRVRELGAGDKHLEELYPWRAERQLYDLIDTVVGQDCSVKFKLLPGEGKFIRVEILRTEEVIGDLAHSNQTKIVGHSVMQREGETGKWVEGDSMRYYMTYHRQISPIDRRSGVYFRASKTTSRWDGEAALQWGNEHLLSDTIAHSERLNTTDTCAYPSIVTRFDSLTQEYRSYVVFGCTTPYVPAGGNGSLDSQKVVEAIVRQSADGQRLSFLRAHSLDAVAGRSLTEWGTPMINASDTANFYCYSDKNRGIIVAWRRPSDIADSSRKIISSERLSWNTVVQPGEDFVFANHPSLNPYSPYIRGEHHSDAALVWQERPSELSQTTQIYYTRLFISNDGTIYHNLSPHIINTPLYVNSDTSVWCVSCDTIPPLNLGSHRFPVVYRDLFYPDTNTEICNWQATCPGHTRHDFRTDNIAWEKEGYLPSPWSTFIPMEINRRVIASLDDTLGGAFIPDTSYIIEREVIWSNGMFSGLWGVTLAPGEAEYKNYHASDAGCYNNSLRSVTMDFNYSDWLVSIEMSPYYYIYQASVPTLLSLASVPIKEVAAGYSPHSAHLAARGSIYKNDWQRGRHIFRADTSVYAPILTSGRHFYKQTENNADIVTLIGFDDGYRHCVISPAHYGSRDYTFQPKHPTMIQAFYTQPDTLVTEWFRVSDFARLIFEFTGDSPELSELRLERRSDGSRWLVPLDTVEDRRLAKLDMLLDNGSDEEYRFEIANRAGGNLRREIVLNINNESMLRATSERTRHIDLSRTDVLPVSVYPNPVFDEARIVVHGVRHSVVEVANIMGVIVLKTETPSDSVARISTAQWAPGWYMAQVKREGLPDATVRFVVVRQ